MIQFSVSTLFVLKEHKRRLKDLEKFAKQVNVPSGSRMTKEAYLAMCEQLNMEPDPSQIPMDIHSLDSLCQEAVAIFNILNDTFVPGTYPMYNGKDLSGLTLAFDLFNITNREDKLQMLEFIRILDSEAKKSAISEYKKATKASNKKPVTNKR